MKTQKKLQAPFERVKLNNSPEIALRYAIVIQAYQDATTVAQNRHAKYARNDAIKWFFRENNYFKEICFEINVDPNLILRNIRNSIEQIHNIEDILKLKTRKRNNQGKNKLTKRVVRLSLSQIQNSQITSINNINDYSNNF